MVTPDEIDRRIDGVDKPRSDRRKEAARTVGTLAAQRATIAAQLEAIDRELGEVLAAAEDDIGVDELAAITDLKAADLTDWLTAARATGRKPGRGDTRRLKTPGGRREAHRTSPTTASPAPGSAVAEVTGAPLETATAGATDPAELHAVGLDSARSGSGEPPHRPERVAQAG